MTNEIDKFRDLLDSLLSQSDSLDMNIVSDYKSDLDTIIKSTYKVWAPIKATMVSCTAKLIYPDWDTRYHQVQIGGKHSLRTIDRKYVASFLFQKGLYPTATEYALTRSFEKAEPFTMNYTGKITPMLYKKSFLRIVDIINTKVISHVVLHEIVKYLLHGIKQYHNSQVIMKSSSISVVTPNITIFTIGKFIQKIFTINHYGWSVVPTIIVHSVLSNLFHETNKQVRKLREHTSPDGNSYSLGDVEVYEKNKPYIIIEVKTSKIDDIIVATFAKKTYCVQQKFILTTKEIPSFLTKDDIEVKNVSHFLIDQLRYYSMFCSKEIFPTTILSSIYQNIISYNNLSILVKKDVENLFKLFTRTGSI